MNNKKMLLALVLICGSTLLALYKFFPPKGKQVQAPVEEAMVVKTAEPETKIIEIAPANFQRIETVTPEVKADVDPAKAARDAILLQEGYGTNGGGYKVKIVPKDREAKVSQTNVGQQ